MSNEQEKYYGTFHDVETGEIITRELTPEEIEVLFNTVPLPLLEGEL
jgi:hypothetical protein